MGIIYLEALVRNRKMKVRTMYQEIKLYNTYAMTGRGFALLLHFTSRRLMCGCIFIQGTITKCGHALEKTECMEGNVEIITINKF
jgi:hypothetical protein